MVISSNDANFQTFLPGCIDYAEGRIYRELDLLFTQVTDNSARVSSGVQEFTVPTSIGTFITVDQLNIITPAGTLSSQGTKVPLVPVSPEFINNAYPALDGSYTATPEYYALRSNSIILLGPVPDGAYYAETIGIQRPASLSVTNSSTILTQYIPDVFMAASLVFGFGYMRDFGGQSDNPQGGQSWEAQYQLLIKSATVEQFRAKHEAQGWTSQSPSPLVQRT
jgi:hypothetical protein